MEIRVQICGVFLWLLGLLLASSTAVTQVIGADAPGYARLVSDSKDLPLYGVNFLIENSGPPYQSFDMFDTRHFDPVMLDRDFAAIARGGYHFVRLWLKGYDPDQGFGLTGPGVGVAYAANVLRAMQLARTHGVRVVLTGAFRQDVWLPRNFLPADLPSETTVGGMNRLLLLPPMAAATGNFYADLLRNLQKRDHTILSTLLYLDLYNELHFDLSQPPFSQSDGVYVFEGEAYDLANRARRQALMDAAGTAWLRRVVTAVHGVDPALPLTASTFPVVMFGHPGFDGGLRAPEAHGDAPYPLRPSVMLTGGAALLDIHLYAAPARGAEVAFHSEVRRLLVESGFTSALVGSVPIIFGEFGSKDLRMENPAASVPEMRATWISMCPLHISGYALWALTGDIAALPSGGHLLLRSFGAATPACKNQGSR